VKDLENGVKLSWLILIIIIIENYKIKTLCASSARPIKKLGNFLVKGRNTSVGKIKFGRLKNIGGQKNFYRQKNIDRDRKIEGRDREIEGRDREIEGRDRKIEKDRATEG
jgi:hypothetical protein